MTNMSAEEQLAQIKSLLGLAGEESENPQRQDETKDQTTLSENAQCPVQNQDEGLSKRPIRVDESTSGDSIVPDGSALILSAFEQARASGKLSWHRMTTAALKSRLLALTDRAFNEGDYGVGTLTEFIRKHSNLVSLDTSLPHPVVELLDPGLTMVGHSDRLTVARPVRIRNDLWQAALDRSSGETYIWDPGAAQVRTGQPLDGDLILPTVDEDTDREWRQKFVLSVDEIEVTTHDDHLTLSTWARSLLPTYRLPSHLIPQWNRFLTSQVIHRLSTWFEQSGLEPPRNFCSTETSRPQRTALDTEPLRQLVLRVVREMTGQELSQLVLPPRAVLRATRSRHHD